MGHTQWCSEQHGVQSFELQLLKVAAIQNLENGECQSGVLYSEPETEQTQSFSWDGEGRRQCEIPSELCVMLFLYIQTNSGYRVHNMIQ